jgi:hypothetical protein
MNTEYKTFTFNIDTPTQVDGFAPMLLESMRDGFVTIDDVRKQYQSKMQALVIQMQVHAELGQVVEEIKTSNEHLSKVFQDFDQRMDYFTLIFFGAVSAGKTSTICDLSNTNPVELTEIIARQRGFDPKTDGFVVGPNVSTMNLYEMLIQRSNIRLVDVPGIGGVVHDNESLAPFVDMADCIVFLINAGNDITADDYDFLRRHVVLVQKHLKDKQQLSQSGMDKKVLVVLNKWNNAFGFRSEVDQDRILKEKADWILDGDSQKGFEGIAHLFANPPAVVRATSAPRDERTGEVYQSADMYEVVEALRDILEYDGGANRLQRPRLVFDTALNKIEKRLYELKTSKQIAGVIKELEHYGVKIGMSSDRMKYQIKQSLDTLQIAIANVIETALRYALDDWKPKVGLFNQFKMLIPDGVADTFNWDSVGKSNVQRELRHIWENELMQAVQSNLDMNKIHDLAKREASLIGPQIRSNYHAEFADASPELKAKIAKIKSNIDSSSEDSKVNLEGMMDRAVKQIENQLVDDILNLVGIDVILVALLNVVLTPIGSFVLIAIRRMIGGNKKQLKIKKAIDNGIRQAADRTSMDIRDKIQQRINQSIDELTAEYNKILKLEGDRVGQPLRMIDEATETIRTYRSQMQALEVH